MHSLSKQGTTTQAAALLSGRTHSAQGYFSDKHKTNQYRGILRTAPLPSLDASTEYQEPYPFDGSLLKSQSKPHGIHSENIYQILVRRLAASESPLQTTHKRLKLQARMLLCHSKTKKEYIQAYDAARRQGSQAPSLPQVLNAGGTLNSTRQRPLYKNGSTKHTYYGLYSPRKPRVQPKNGNQQVGLIGKFDETTKGGIGWPQRIETSQERKLTQIRKAAALHSARHQSVSLAVTLGTSLSIE